MYKIALLDGDQSYRHALELFLNTIRDYRTVGSWNNAEAALKGLSLIDQPDLILLESKLPDLSCLEFVRFLDNIDHQFKWVVLSQWLDHKEFFDIIRAGTSGYLLKKDGPESIDAAICQVRQGEVALSREIAKMLVSILRQQALKQEKVYYKRLTGKEQTVMNMLAMGKTYRQIADECHVSIETIKKHIKNMYRKLGVDNNVEAVGKWKSAWPG